MKNTLNKLFRFLGKKSNSKALNLPSTAKYQELTKIFLLENIATHQTYAERINSYRLWDNFQFDHKLGSMEFSNDAEGFALAFDRGSILQAQAMNKLNNDIDISTKVLSDGTIFVNLRSVEFQQVFTCSSIKWFKKD